MRILIIAPACAALLGCAVSGTSDPALACEAQGYAPGTEEWRVCMDADGARIATGPGSPYAIAQQIED